MLTIDVSIFRRAPARLVLTDSEETATDAFSMSLASTPVDNEAPSRGGLGSSGKLSAEMVAIRDRDRPQLSDTQPLVCAFSTSSLSGSIRTYSVRRCAGMAADPGACMVAGQYEIPPRSMSIPLTVRPFASARISSVPNTGIVFFRSAKVCTSRRTRAKSVVRTTISMMVISSVFGSGLQPCSRAPKSECAVAWCSRACTVEADFEQPDHPVFASQLLAEAPCRDEQLRQNCPGQRKNGLVPPQPKPSMTMPHTTASAAKT